MSARAVAAAATLVGLVVVAVLLSPAVPDAWSDGPWVAGCAAVGIGVAAVAVLLSGRGSRPGSRRGARAVPAVAAVAVVLVAVLGAVVTAVDDDPARGVAALVSALVVATPCLVGLAAASATRAGLGRARRLGVRFDGATALEQVAALDLLLLPGDGVLTTGELRVDEVQAIDPDDERTLRWFAGALAHGADDPVARAVRRLSARGTVTDLDSRPGEGFSGAVDRHPVRVGRPDWIGVTATPGPGTCVGVEVDGRALGSLRLLPELVPDAADHLTRLRALGVAPRLVASASPDADRELAQRLGLDGDGGDAGDAGDAGVAGPGASRTTSTVGVVVESVTAAGTDPITPDVTISRTATTRPVALDLNGGDVGALASAVGVARASRRAAAVTGRIAVVSLVAVPVASFGLLAPVVAACLALLTALGVAAYASLETRTSPPRPAAATAPV
ncbi:cation-translocating P-type ATPase [Nocardioides plantarum]|uniref:Cation-translocating P-type ATPase n=1 Tax=Nocardioides plantarum TaxID=29299 RepID=A0ABV5KFV2_9ACTN|nr:cation-translocating P-type ATPase [Nocardioides plantarum]